MSEAGIRNATVLAIVAAGDDRLSLSGVFVQSDWKLAFAGDLVGAQAALRTIHPGVVLCDGRLPGGHTWKDLLHEMLRMKEPPPLIVIDRLADERLWAEALNLGAHDLLATPFDAREVWHAVTTACRRHENDQAMAANRRPEKAAKNSGKAAMGARGSAP